MTHPNEIRVREKIAEHYDAEFYAESGGVVFWRKADTFLAETLHKSFGLAMGREGARELYIALQAFLHHQNKMERAT